MILKLRMISSDIRMIGSINLWIFCAFIDEMKQK